MNTVETLNFSGLYLERSFNARNKITPINIKERTVGLRIDRPCEEIETTLRFYKLTRVLVIFPYTTPDS